MERKEGLDRSQPTFTDTKAGEDNVRAHAEVLGDGRVNLDLQHVWLESQSLPPLPQKHDEPETGNVDVTPPHMNIVIQVVGSRGDIQPLVALGVALKQTGHRVRIATHPTFRAFVKDVGLEFFSIGGDPTKLMAYMVKNPGLLPRMESLRKGSVAEKRDEMREVLEGCWHSCFMPDDEEDSSHDPTPFLANVIIANPPSFAHVHCAEKLGIPLHLMFTMPWSPTQAIPHPLANMQSSSLGTRFTNYLSYMLLEELIWEGLGDTINSFRRQTLGLPYIDRSSGPNLVSRLQIPYTYCWSPALIPKPEDWGAQISVSGFYFLPLASRYTPPANLQAFLDGGEPPIYIGFGSIVVDDPKSLTELLLEAVRLAGVRAVISTGWSGLGGLDIPPEVCTVADCPHDWIFRRVSSVVHHGGAGTTAAALAAGKPSVVVPFFGDQPFWGKMIARAGAGPEPIPFKKLTAVNLAVAIKDALGCCMQKVSRSLGDIVNDEDGVQVGVRSFHEQLDLSIMKCSLTPMSAATWRVRKTNIRLGSTSSALLMDRGLLDLEKLELLRPCSYSLHVGPRNPIFGVTLAMIDSVREAIKGFQEIGSSMNKNFSQKPTTQRPGHSRFRQSRTGTCLKGIGRASATMVQAPVHMGVAFTQGLHNTSRLWGDQTVRPLEDLRDLGNGLQAGGKEMWFGVYDGVTGLVTHPVSGFQRHSALGVLFGVGTGILSGISKTTSGLLAIFTYPLGGLDAEATGYFSSKYMSSMEAHLVEQGRAVAANLSDEERAGIIEQWQAITADVKKSRYKSRHGRFRKHDTATQKLSS